MKSVSKRSFSIFLVFTLLAAHLLTPVFAARRSYDDAPPPPRSRGYNDRHYREADYDYYDDFYCESFYDDDEDDDYNDVERVEISEVVNEKNRKKGSRVKVKSAVPATIRMYIGNNGIVMKDQLTYFGIADVKSMNMKFMILPDEGFDVDTVVWNGKNVSEYLNDCILTLPNLEDGVLRVRFRRSGERQRRHRRSHGEERGDRRGEEGELRRHRGEEPPCAGGEARWCPWDKCCSRCCNPRTGDESTEKIVYFAVAIILSAILFALAMPKRRKREALSK